MAKLNFKRWLPKEGRNNMKVYKPDLFFSKPAKKKNLPAIYSKPRAMFGKAKQMIGKVGRLTGVWLALTGAAYVAGTSSRRYKKAPKPGENRDLRDMILDQPSKRTYYL